TSPGFVRLQGVDSRPNDPRHDVTDRIAAPGKLGRGEYEALERHAPVGFVERTPRVHAAGDGDRTDAPLRDVGFPVPHVLPGVGGGRRTPAAVQKADSPFLLDVDECEEIAADP